MSKRINTAFEKKNVTLAAQFIIGNSMGSGIYVAHQNSIYFCTARHVLFAEGIANKKTTFSLRNTIAKIKSYPQNSNFRIHNELELNLVSLFKTKDISFHSSIDLCVIKIGDFTKKSLKLITGVKKVTKTVDLNVANSSMIKPSKSIEVGEETYVIGYPKALAKFKPNAPLYNYELPLVRKGIISCMNDYKTFIIDCAVYGGNSGGPVFVAENTLTQLKDGFQIRTKTYLVGIVTKYIPLVNTTSAYKSNIDGSQITISNLENSGYGICIAFDLIEKEIKKQIAAKLKLKMKTASTK